MNDEAKNKIILEIEQKRKKTLIIEVDDSIQESYQPTEDSLDDNNPPRGSGVPDKGNN